MRLILAFQRLQKQYDQTGKPLIYTAHTVTVSSHIHQRVSAGEPDKQHSHRGDWWSVDNPVPSEGSQTPCSHAPVSPRARCWRLRRWHTHLLPQFTGPDSGAIEEIEIVMLWCYQRMSKKWCCENSLIVPAQPFRPFQLVTAGLGKLVLACGIRWESAAVDYSS